MRRHLGPSPVAGQPRREQGRTGAELWLHGGTPNPGQSSDGVDAPFGLATSPDGAVLYAVGVSESVLTGAADLFVSALSADDGVPENTARFTDSDGGHAMAANAASNPASLAHRPQVLVHPDGQQVFVAGGFTADGHHRVAVVAYDTDQL